MGKHFDAGQILTSRITAHITSSFIPSPPVFRMGRVGAINKKHATGDDSDGRWEGGGVCIDLDVFFTPVYIISVLNT